MDALPDDDPDLTGIADSARKFLLELETAEPETLMDAAVSHGKTGQAMDAFTNAERARAVLERLMSEPEPFPMAAKGQAPQFNIPRLDVNESLRQLTLSDDSKVRRAAWHALITARPAELPANAEAIAKDPPRRHPRGAA